jgi:5-methylcytosine-specific restriction endonuclease McrA
LSDFDKLKIECYYSIAAMLTRENNESWHVDHVLPLQGKSMSGLHVPNNLQLLRGEENSRKGNRT